MGNLAVSLKYQGDLIGALELEEKVLAARERVLGADHPDTLRAKNNFLNSIGPQGDLVGIH